MLVKFAGCLAGSALAAVGGWASSEMLMGGDASKAEVLNDEGVESVEVEEVKEQVEEDEEKSDSDNLEAGSKVLEESRVSEETEGLILARSTYKVKYRKEGYAPVTDYAGMWFKVQDDIAFRNVISMYIDRVGKSDIDLYKEGCKDWSEALITDSRFGKDAYSWMVEKGHLKNYCFKKIGFRSGR